MCRPLRSDHVHPHHATWQRLLGFDGHFYVGDTVDVNVSLGAGFVAEETLVTHQGGQPTIAVIADAIMRAFAVCLESNLLCFLHLLLFAFKDPPEGKELM